MFILGLILALVGFFCAIKVLIIIGIILLVVGLLGNGYAHFGTDRRRYWF